MTLEILLRRFGGSPVGSQRREFPHHERFDERTLRFLIIRIRAYIPDVRVGETNNLAGITGIAENFLIAGETRIKNDFPAAPCDGAGGAPAKNSSVLERENGRAYRYFRQRFLPKASWPDPDLFNGCFQTRSQTKSSRTDSRASRQIRPCHK